MQNNNGMWKIACPHCKDNQFSINGTDEIVCSNCKKSYLINQSANKAKSKDVTKIIKYVFKLRCPHGCKHPVMYDVKFDINVSIRCPICDRFFQGNLNSGETWLAKAIPCF